MNSRFICWLCNKTVYSQVKWNLINMNSTSLFWEIQLCKWSNYGYVQIDVSNDNTDQVQLTRMETEWYATWTPRNDIKWNLLTPARALISKRCQTYDAKRKSKRWIDEIFFLIVCVHEWVLERWIVGTFCLPSHSRRKSNETNPSQANLTQPDPTQHEL